MNTEKMSKRKERRAQLQRQQQQRTIIVALIVAGAALVILAVIWRQLQSTTSAETAAAEIVTAAPVSLPSPDGLSLGDANAPATIDVFEDFQCPACQFFSQNVEPLVIQNLVASGKARYVYHNYPFIDGDGAANGGESDQAANASMCANEQGKFWEMHHTLYANWDGENQGAFSDSRLRAIAEKVGLDLEAFDQCFAANKYQADIQADFDLGKQMGVRGTPTVFVNGKHAGEQGKIATYADIEQAVTEASK